MVGVVDDVGKVRKTKVEGWRAGSSVTRRLQREVSPGPELGIEVMAAMVLR